ncbi:MAG: DUF4331 domain-containing protein [Nitrospiria bacterium]
MEKLYRNKQPFRLLYRVATGCALAGALGAFEWPATPAQASSHREAPFITEQPKVDATDFYLFNSYETGRAGFVTVVADYLPLQDPAGGPNFFMMDPDALYEIHFDNDGDAKEDVTFQFRFQHSLKDAQLSVGGKLVSIPLINSGPVGGSNGTANLNVTETYTVKRVKGNRRSGQVESVTNAEGGASTFAKPVDNIGEKSLPDYRAYADQHIYSINIPGCSGTAKMFVGQRKDPFVINVGETLDLINLNPLGPVNGEADDLARKNVTSLILEVPVGCLASDAHPVIGGWTTASLRQGRLINPRSSFAKPVKEGGPWAQVSRLGMPLVNEVVIGLKDKDAFNSSKPKDDAQFADYVTNPTLPALIETLFGVIAPTTFPRTDLVAVFLTGVEGVNQTEATAEMLRLNTSLPATPAGQQNNLGAALCFVNGALTLDHEGCDPAGFPNGRRPGDDVVDIALRVAMGYLLPAADAPDGQKPYTDGAVVNAGMFYQTFPYVKTPLPGSPN